MGAEEEGGEEVAEEQKERRRGSCGKRAGGVWLACGWRQRHWHAITAWRNDHVACGSTAAVHSPWQSGRLRSE